MIPAPSYQLYMYEHGRTVAEQRAANARAGEVAAELRNLRLSFRRAFRPGRSGQTVRRAAGVMIGTKTTASAQALTSHR